MGRPSVQLSEPLHQREPDAHAATARGFPLAERLEERELQLVGNTRAVVLDHDLDTVGLGREVHQHRGTQGCVTRGVDEQVLDDPLDLAGVDIDQHGIGSDAHGMA